MSHGVVSKLIKELIDSGLANPPPEDPIPMRIKVGCFDALSKELQEDGKGVILTRKDHVDWRLIFQPARFEGVSEIVIDGATLGTIESKDWPKHVTKVVYRYTELNSNHEFSGYIKILDLGKLRFGNLTTINLPPKLTELSMTDLTIRSFDIELPPTLEKLTISDCVISECGHLSWKSLAQDQTQSTIETSAGLIPTHSDKGKCDALSKEVHSPQLAIQEGGKVLIYSEKDHVNHEIRSQAKLFEGISEIVINGAKLGFISSTNWPMNVTKMTYKGAEVPQLHEFSEYMKILKLERVIFKTVMFPPKLTELSMGGDMLILSTTVLPPELERLTLSNVRISGDGRLFWQKRPKDQFRPNTETSLNGYSSNSQADGSAPAAASS